MGKVKQIEIKNRTFFFCFLQQHDQSQMFQIKLVKNRQKHYKGIDIYYLGYVTIKKIGDCENIHNVICLPLLVNHAS